MKTPQWAQSCFDGNWCRCSYCSVEYPKKNVQGKRKCPTCKLNGQYRLPIKHIQKKGKGVTINGQFLSPNDIKEATALLEQS